MKGFCQKELGISLLFLNLKRILIENQTESSVAQDPSKPQVSTL